MQRKIVVIHHGHSLSATVHVAWLVHRVRRVSNALEVLAMIPTYGA